MLIDTGIFGPGPSKADTPAVGQEIALRICNYRYGQFIGLPPTPPLPPGLPVSNQPGEDGVDDDRFLADSAWSTNVGTAPTQRDTDDNNAWVWPNWRPDPAVDGIDENGDGIIDEVGERVDNPLEFIQFPSPPRVLPAPWPVNNDQPFGAADLSMIVKNTPPAPGDPPLKAIVNDVLLTWAGANGVPGYGAGVVANDDYFELLRAIFTTQNSDYIGTMTPVNHLNLLLPVSPTPAEASRVGADRTRFVAAMRGVLAEGGMDAAAADNTAWQICANLIDFLDDDTDSLGSRFWDAGNTLPRDILTVLVKTEGWNVATNDTNGNGVADPGEAGTRTFHGTERQPYVNEVLDIQPRRRQLRQRRRRHHRQRPRQDAHARPRPL